MEIKVFMRTDDDLLQPQTLLCLRIISRGIHKTISLPIKELFGIWSASLTVLKDERSKMAQI